MYSKVSLLDHISTTFTVQSSGAFLCIHCIPNARSTHLKIPPQRARPPWVPPPPRPPCCPPPSRPPPCSTCPPCSCSPSTCPSPSPSSQRRCACFHQRFLPTCPAIHLFHSPFSSCSPCGSPCGPPSGPPCGAPCDTQRRHPLSAHPTHPLAQRRSLHSFCQPGRKVGRERIKE